MELKKSLYRVDEVAEYFNVNRSTIYRWIDNGVLKSEKYVKTIRISRESIEQLREDCKHDPMQ
jgi:excisionase family DNA binding protein